MGREELFAGQFRGHNTEFSLIQWVCSGSMNLVLCPRNWRHG